MNDFDDTEDEEAEETPGNVRHEESHQSPPPPKRKRLDSTTLQQKGYTMSTPTLAEKDQVKAVRQVLFGETILGEFTEKLAVSLEIQKIKKTKKSR